MSRVAQLRQDLGGVRPATADKIKDHLDPLCKTFIENAPFAVMATSNSEGDCDASPKGGKPGFVKVIDDRTLLLPDIGGNRLLQSYENFESNPKAGLIFMIPGMGFTVRVNGRVEIMEREAVEALGIVPELNFTDTNSRLVQGLKLHIEEAYTHCARSAQFAALWDTDQIEENAKRSLKDLMNDATPPNR